MSPPDDRLLMPQKTHRTSCGAAASHIFLAASFGLEPSRRQVAQASDCSVSGWGLFSRFLSSEIASFVLAAVISEVVFGATHVAGLLSAL
jgi:hypothetical protein